MNHVSLYDLPAAVPMTLVLVFAACLGAFGFVLLVRAAGRKANIIAASVMAFALAVGGVAGVGMNQLHGERKALIAQEIQDVYGLSLSSEQVRSLRYPVVDPSSETKEYGTVEATSGGRLMLVTLVSEDGQMKLFRDDAELPVAGMAPGDTPPKG